MKDLFSWNGRIGRLKYFGIYAAFTVVYMILAFLATKSSALFVVLGLYYLVYTYVSVITAIKRLHDLDRPGVHFLLLLIPFYNIYLGLVLLFKKGTEGSNTYGDSSLAA